MLEQDLRNLGLSEKEAIIYLASLELGASTIQELSKKAQIKRSSTYDLISFLIERGLMGDFIKGKKKLFIAEPPERLASLIRIQKKELEEKERGLQRIIPELNNLIDISKRKTKVRFYEGKEGIRIIQEDILMAKIKDLDNIISLDDSYRVFPPHQRDHRHRLWKRRIPIRTIYTSRRGSILPTKEKLIERHFISYGKFPFNTEIVIYGNKVAFVSHQNKLIGGIFEDDGIAQTTKIIFDLAWKTSK